MPLPRPDFIFAAHDSKNSHRPRETVVPLALQFKLPIDDRFHSTAPTKDQMQPGAQTWRLRDELFKGAEICGQDDS